jgi:hypothetical protein
MPNPSSTPCGASVQTHDVATRLEMVKLTLIEVLAELAEARHDVELKMGDDEGTRRSLVGAGWTLDRAMEDVQQLEARVDAAFSVWSRNVTCA